MDIADDVVLLVDGTKFATSAPVLLCSFDSVNALVTDMAPPEDVVEALDKAGTVLHRSDGR
jgi:DeoR/GlpR family transcriptional regulator of sugar metabolism